MRVRTSAVVAGLAVLAWLPAEGVDRAPGPLLLAQGGSPVYKPPQRGAPGGRIGGGTRGAGHQPLVLSALAPDHTGLTTQEQPSLFWFLSSPTTLRLEFTLNDPQGTRPIVDVQLPAPAQAGVQRIRLADHGVRLAPGVVYTWFVAAVADPDRRSRDILAGGAIQRVELAPALRDRLEAAAAPERPALYGEAGLWYDCLAALADLIDARPGDAALRRQRAALLEQVGLGEIAKHDLTHGS
jgi:hypothetical protein